MTTKPQSTTTKLEGSEPTLEPSLEDLAIEAAELLDSLPTYVSDQTIRRAQQIAFALRACNENARACVLVPTVDDDQPCPDPRCNDHLGASPMPQCVTAVYWSEEVLAVADVLRQFSDQFNGIDNGRCTVCRVGHRLWIVPGKKKGACDYSLCLSHQIDAILDRYEPCSPETLERIRKNCEAAIRSGRAAAASTVAPEPQYLTINGQRRMVIPCPDGKPDCEVLHTAPAPSAAIQDETDDLVDEVQHRMDQVVEAAVEWHQAGREGTEWFEAAEKLGAAINSLLELRGDPQNIRLPPS